jgi:hypothetical protein
MALLATLAAATMVFGYLLTSRLNAASQFVGQNREHNAKQLSQAKQALIGWAAMNAAGDDANPGRFPCPEAPANYADTTGTNQGVAAGNCTLPAVGRLPWRTLGLDRLVDAAGEPLWYVVSPGWALPSSTATLTINAESVGQLSVNGNEAVALIIAPGPAMSAQSGAGCTAWTQVRPREGSGVAPDHRNYLECENAASPATTSFVAARPGQTFNDQVLRVSAADVMPALEAAIAGRIDRQIAPELKKVFALDTNFPRRWVTTSTSPLYPYAAPFANPGPGAGTSNYVGSAGTYQGLLPVNQTQGCTASASNPRCQPSLVAYQSIPANAQETLGYGYIMSQSCGWDGPSGEAYLCEGQYHEYDSDPTRPIRIEMQATFTNVALGLRRIDTTRMQIQARDNGGTEPWVSPSIAYRAEMNDGSVGGKPKGSVTIRFWATMPNIDTQGWETFADFRVRIERAVINDHALLDPTHATLGWFVRNEWFRNLYYAAAQNNTADGLPSTTGCDSTNCLRANDSSLRNIRALLVLAGQRLDTQTRPSSDPLNYVEEQNGDGGTVYEQRLRRFSKVAMSPTTVPPYSFYAPWNDRYVLVDWISAPTSVQLSLLP